MTALKLENFQQTGALQSSSALCSLQHPRASDSSITQLEDRRAAGTTEALDGARPLSKEEFMKLQALGLPPLLPFEGASAAAAGTAGRPPAVSHSALGIGPSGQRPQLGGPAGLPVSMGGRGIGGGAGVRPPPRPPPGMPGAAPAVPGGHSKVVQVHHLDVRELCISYCIRGCPFLKLVPPAAVVCTPVTRTLLSMPVHRTKSSPSSLQDERRRMAEEMQRIQAQNNRLIAQMARLEAQVCGLAIFTLCPSRTADLAHCRASPRQTPSQGSTEFA